ncbi:uncharacterized protein LOC141631944 [Silene latifolia]|uniref:uncharacterized protein LOC141631944 n=1 Tax=Silene latifolia TaxID=37657 RepID=UPI003D788DBB
MCSSFKQFFLTHNYNSHYNGRIWLLWKSSLLKVSVISEANQWITVHVKMLMKGLVIVSLYFFELDDFNACLDDASLNELSTMGCFFTWTNNQQPASRKWIKLDRVLCNGEWLLKETVAQVWSTKVRGTKNVPAGYPFKNVKPRLKEVNACSYSHLSDRVQDAQDKLRSCQLLLQVSPTDGTLLEEEAALSRAYFHLKKSELSMLHQRAKEHDISAMDTNSAYFFSKVAARKNSNSISKVHDMNGIICDDIDSIGKAFEEYYRKSLGVAETPI